MNKKFLRIIVAVLVIFGLMRLYYRSTDDFRIGNITYDMPYHAEWETPRPSEKERKEIDSILKEEFTYIGKGAQSYAFSSADGKYVLKFFKFKHLTPHWFVELFPPVSPFKEYRIKQSMRKSRKLIGVFEGYSLAYNMHKSDSGLLFMHLNRTKSQFGEITVRDKLRLPRKIDLDSVVFIIQEKAATTRAVINDALKQGDTATAKQKIRQIFDLYASEYRKGIYDKDHGVMHNTGFVQGRPIHLDVGKMTRDENVKKDEVWQADMTHIGWKFVTWIEQTYPEYHQELSRDIEDTLSGYFGRSFDFASSTKPVKRKK